MSFSEALDAPAASEARRRVESHCAECAICGPEWRTLLTLEKTMEQAPRAPAGLADRVMAALPAPAPARRETLPLAAAGLLVAAGLLALQLAAVSDAAAPWIARLTEWSGGISEVVKERAAAAPWALSGWVAAAAAAIGALSGAALLRVRRITN
jgi:hypothetical protein